MMMKKIGIIAEWLAMVLLAVSCNKVKRKPGSVYMPDMAYSRAYETYFIGRTAAKRS